MMKIDHVIILLLQQFAFCLRNTFADSDDLVNVGIIADKTGESFFSDEMHFSSQLLFNAADHRRSEDDITDGGKPYDEDLFQKDKNKKAAPS
jgi:hypothetical protein